MLRANNKGAETAGVVLAVVHVIAEAFQVQACVELHSGHDVVDPGVHAGWNKCSSCGDLFVYLLF